MDTEDRENLVNRVYAHILKTANRILHNAKNYSIAVLQLEDPSYTDMAEQLEEVCGILDLIASDFEDEHTIAKAKEYVQHTKLIAIAIADGDEEALAKHVLELDKRSFL